MNAKHLIWVLTAASLLSSASVSVLRAQAEKQASHGAVRGPVPEAVRKATEPYRDVNAAIAAGYVKNGGCVSGPEEGVMGVHFANFALFDGTVDVENPEALVYEPRNGRLHLVAAEYVVPASAWNPNHAPSDKPHLMDHLFHSRPGPATATVPIRSTSCTSGPGRTIHTGASLIGTPRQRVRSGEGRRSSVLESGFERAGTGLGPAPAIEAGWRPGALRKP